MAELETMRRPALAGFHGGSSAVSLTAGSNAARASLRAYADAVAPLSTALGITLPTVAKTSSFSNGILAMWLGPDEWLLIGPDGIDFVGLAAKSGVLHSAVDVSHRNIAIMVSGPGAKAAVNSACPHDLGEVSFPVGACSRTVFGKMEIVLHRESADTYRVECWRSFADYCFGMLAEGAHDAAI